MLGFGQNGSGPVGDALRSRHASAVGAAIEVAVCFYTVPDHLDVAVLAGRCEGVNRTLETVEGARLAPGRTYLEGLIVLISTDFALGHNSTPLPGRCDCQSRT